jgi:2-polyprenyl-3-methyl-5-hydroxy-6-metoxy-1,4-benzoquinol methylase
MKKQEQFKVGREMVHIPCPVCGGEDRDSIYVRYQETGSFLGRIKIENVLCSSCSFMYMNPRPTREAMSRYYSELIASSGNIACSTEENSRYLEITRERTDFISAVVRGCLDTGIGSVLDVGCSQGFLLESLSLSGWKLTGLEPSREASSIARGKGLEMIEGFIENTVLQPETYDVALCISTLEHVYDLKSAMQNISRGLKMGGLIFFEVPNSLTPVPQIAEFYSFEHLSHFSPASLKRLINSHGLEIIKYDNSRSLPNLRLAARKISQAPIPENETGDDRDALLEAIDVYKKMRGKFEKDLIRKFKPLVDKWKKNKWSIGIYGAGFHTHFLLNLIDLSEQVAYVFDSDVRKQGARFLHWMVYGPEDIEQLRPEVIIISSRPYQEEIYGQIAHYKDTLGTEIVRCYG